MRLLPDDDVVDLGDLRRTGIDAEFGHDRYERLAELLKDSCESHTSNTCSPPPPRFEKAQ